MDLVNDSFSSEASGETVEQRDTVHVKILTALRSFHLFFFYNIES